MGLITITGRVLLPDGNGPVSGEIIATLSKNAVLGNDVVVSRKQLHVPDGGDLALSDPAATIQSNDGLSPADTFYDVEYVLRDRDGAAYGKRELWQLAGSGSQAIGSFPTITVPPGLVIDGIVPFFGASEPPATSDYIGALRRWQPAGMPEIYGIALRDWDGSIYWKRIVDGAP